LTTVAEAADLFITALRGRHASPNTIKAYASDLRRFVGAMAADLAALDAAAIRAFLDGDTDGAAARGRRDATRRVRRAPRRGGRSRGQRVLRDMTNERIPV